jgi:uncharacterized SAM-binding protein YcdF (DUF218 family)
VLLGRLLRIVVAVVGLLVVAALVWAASISVRIWWDARGQDTTPTDGLVVLGAAQWDGTPSPVFRSRLLRAQELFDAGVAPRIFTTGGRLEGDRLTEAEAGRNFLVRNGVPESSIVVLPVGNATSQSMAAVAEYYQQQGLSTATLVTDPWHTFRSEAIADDYGIEARSAPVQSGPIVQSRTVQLRYIMRETAAYISWVLFGETDIQGPDATRN